MLSQTSPGIFLFHSDELGSKASLRMHAGLKGSTGSVQTTPLPSIIRPMNEVGKDPISRPSGLAGATNSSHAPSDLPALIKSHPQCHACTDTHRLWLWDFDLLCTRHTAEALGISITHGISHQPARYLFCDTQLFKRILVKNKANKKPPK